MHTERKPVLYAILGAALILVVLAAGCTTTTPPAPTPTPTTVPPTTIAMTVETTAPPETTAPTTEETTVVTTLPPTTTAAPTPAPVPVVIQNYGFNPQTVTVPAGTTVTWTNLDSIQHQVANSKTAAFGPGLMFQSAILGKGDSYSYTFTTAGTYEYYCPIHPFMIGTVFVK
ncbi:MAG TPA: plastocyanin/azurin family copper-binding protein [Methanomicrobiales archaeon]|nr:plastocyanin/azurin family copper-binding protein [Methanomicrobiales archaeon]